MPSACAIYTARGSSDLESMFLNTDAASQVEVLIVLSYKCLKIKHLPIDSCPQMVTLFWEVLKNFRKWAKLEKWVIEGTF